MIVLVCVFVCVPFFCVRNQKTQITDDLNNKQHKNSTQSQMMEQSKALLIHPSGVPMQHPVPVDWNELHAAHVGAILALLEVTAQQAE
jgi:hypothetical protein